MASLIMAFSNPYVLNCLSQQGAAATCGVVPRIYMLAGYAVMMAYSRMPAIPDVGAAVIIRGDRVFVTRRGPAEKMAGLWEFPGGKVAPAETMQACIIREVAEELAVDCLIGEVFGSNLHRYDSGATNLIDIRVDMTTNDWQLTVHNEARCFTRDELISLELAPADVPIATKMRALLLGLPMEI
jgi:8-oxo-dGTP diphosphatase